MFTKKIKSYKSPKLKSKNSDKLKSEKANQHVFFNDLFVIDDILLSKLL